MKLGSMMLIMLALGTLRCATNPNSTSKNQAVSDVSGCQYPCWQLAALALRDEHAKGFACIAQAKPSKLCMLMFLLLCFARMSSDFAAPMPMQDFASVFNLSSTFRYCP